MNKKNLIIIVITLLVLIMIGGFILLFTFVNNSGEKTEKVKEIPTYNVSMEDLYCNIKDSKKMVKINIVIETISEELKAELESKSFLIRDQVNNIIVSKTEEDLLGENGQVNLKKDILEILSETLKTEQISNIYFNDFIIQ